MKKYLCIYISALLLLNLVGCGTKGPLYIPEKKYPQNTTPDTISKPAPKLAKRLRIAILELAFTAKHIRWSVLRSPFLKDSKV